MATFLLTVTTPAIDYEQLALQIKQWGKDLGFAEVGITDIDLTKHEAQLQRWLDLGYHGEMEYMAAHGMKRARPAELVPGTQRVISVKMNYLPPDASFAKNLKQTDKAYISRYALGRDYHKLIRNRLKKLGQKIEQQVGQLGFRPFVDSAPVLERQLAEKAGLGWRGKHSLLINKEAGSWFFLGELFVDIPLPIDEENSFEGCGKCVACMTLCPTGAIVEPYVVDARKCISYLTIEFKGKVDLSGFVTEFPFDTQNGHATMLSAAYDIPYQGLNNPRIGFDYFMSNDEYANPVFVRESLFDIYNSKGKACDAYFIIPLEPTLNWKIGYRVADNNEDSSDTEDVKNFYTSIRLDF